MQLNLSIWKRLWVVLTVLAVAFALVVVPQAGAQETTTPNAESTTPSVAGEAGGEPEPLNPGGEPETDTVPPVVENAPQPALEQVNNPRAIKFSDFKITRKDGKSEPELFQHDFAFVDVDWEAPNGITANQKFVIRLPKELRLYGASFPLVGEGRQGGTCTTSDGYQQLNCVFNDEFEKDFDVNGSIHIEVQAQRTTSEDKLPISVDDTNGLLDLPGTKGILGRPDVIGKDINKVGWYNNDWITGGWRVDIPGGAVDGKGSEAVEVTDVLDNHVFDESRVPTISAHEVEVKDDGTFEIKNTLATKNVDSFVVSNGGKNATFKISPPNESGKWEPNLHYRLRYNSKTENGKEAELNQLTWNNVTIFGDETQNKKTAVKRSYSNSGVIRGVKRASYGVKKVLSDPSFEKFIPESTRFEVQADIELATGGTKQEKIFVALNGEHNGLQELPEGSIVTLSEPNMPDVLGMKFSKPVFSAGENTNPADLEILDNGARVRFKTVAGPNINVVLTNHVEAGPAQFAIVKKTAGADAAKTKDFKFTYVCDVEGEKKTGEIIAKGDGKSVLSAEKFPVGTNCEITEDERTAQIDGYTLIAEPANFTQKITIAREDSIAYATFTNTYARMAGGLAVTKQIADRSVAGIFGDEEFKFEVSWNIDGKTQKREFMLRDGDVFDDFPRLPLGTKVTIKELLPDDSMWVAPAFTANVSGAVSDKGDGVAEATVLAEDANLLVTVTNIKNTDPALPPSSGSGGLGWLALLGLIPLLGGLGSSQSGGSSTPGAPAPSAPAPNVVAPGQSPDGVGGGQPQKGVPAPNNQAPVQGAPVKASPQLARTGAGVLGVIALALVAVAVGVFLVRRARR